MKKSTRDMTFRIVYGKLRNKHPNWVHRQLAYGTLVAIGEKRKGASK